MLVYGVFDLREPDRCRYVGLTRGLLEKRAKSHWHSRDSAQTPMAKFIRSRRDVWDRILFVVLEDAEDEPHMKMLERFWIAQYRDIGMADLNVTDGGEGGSGMKMSPEHLQKLTQISRDRWANNPEYAEKVRKALWERMQLPEQRAASSARLKKAHMDGKILPHRGEENGRAVLSRGDVADAREMRESGMTYVSIAKIYNVTPECVSQAVRGISWGFLKEDN